MKNYIQYLSYLKCLADAKVLTNLVQPTDIFRINHNAATAAVNLGLVRKRKSGTYKWVSKKKPARKLAELLLEESSRITNAL